MKPVIRCRDCATAHYVYEPGFTGRVYLACVDRDTEVSGDDGCTFGVEGDHGTLKANYDVTVEGCAAVNGYEEK